MLDAEQALREHEAALKTAEGTAAGIAAQIRSLEARRASGRRIGGSWRQWTARFRA